MKYIIYDLETIKGCFLASFYFPEEDRWVDFLINQYQNDLYKLIEFLGQHQEGYVFVGFNNISFDAQVIEFIWRNWEKWHDRTTLQMSSDISDFGGDCIDDQQYGARPTFSEENLSFRQLDVPRILHWFNENKRVSLKQAEFELRAENIENFEFPVDKLEFTEEELWGEKGLVVYCHNDVWYTYEILLHIEGRVNHPLYKGKDKIFDRKVVKETTGLDCLNWDDVKIGAEWNKKDYLEATGIEEKELRPKKVPQPYGKRYKHFFPPTVSYQSKQLKRFLAKFGDSVVLPHKQEFKFNFEELQHGADLIITMAKGGLHSCEGPRQIIPAEDEIYLQCDKGSQYPNAIHKLGICPAHLRKEVWTASIPKKVELRLSRKKLYKDTKDPKYNSLQEMGKLQLNGGCFGQLGLKGSWQEDQVELLKVTLGCQMEIMMVVEALVLKGFKVVSVNTDGFDVVLKKDRLDEFFQLMDDYEKITMDDKMGKFEYTVFDWLAQTSVNHYMAPKLGVYENRKFKEDTIVLKESAYPNLKMKGLFATEVELHKNSSFHVVSLALAEYFSNGTNVEDFINAHNDIFDFCGRSNSGKTFKHEGYGRLVDAGSYTEEQFEQEWVEVQRNSTVPLYVRKDWMKESLEDEEEQDRLAMTKEQAIRFEKRERGKYEMFPLPKLIRYYVSKEGIHIRKAVKEGNETGARSHGVSPADYLKTVCNQLPKKDYERHLANVNRQWYIDQAMEIILRIGLRKKKLRRDKVDPAQLSIFG